MKKFRKCRKCKKSFERWFVSQGYNSGYPHHCKECWNDYKHKLGLIGKKSTIIGNNKMGVMLIE